MQTNLVLSITRLSKFLLIGVSIYLISIGSSARPRLEHITNLNELSVFMQTYYVNPQPELIPDVIRYIGSHDLLSKYKNAIIPTQVFFSTVVAENPSAKEKWLKLTDQQDPKTTAILTKALNETPEQIIVATPNSPARNDAYWAAYFASGNLQYLNKIIDQLKYLDERKNLNLYMTAASAEWSLAGNARTDQKVGLTVMIMLGGDNFKMRGIASDILNKGPEGISAQIKAVFKEQHEKGIW